MGIDSLDTLRLLPPTPPLAGRRDGALVRRIEPCASRRTPEPRPLSGRHRTTLPRRPQHHESPDEWHRSRTQHEKCPMRTRVRPELAGSEPAPARPAAFQSPSPGPTPAPAETPSPEPEQQPTRRSRSGSTTGLGMLPPGSRVVGLCQVDGMPHGSQRARFISGCPASKGITTPGTPSCGPTRDGTATSADGWHDAPPDDGSGFGTKSAVGDHLGTTRLARGQTTCTSTGRAHGADTIIDLHRWLLPRVPCQNSIRDLDQGFLGSG